MENIIIFLTVEKFKYVLIEPCPPKHTEWSMHEQKVAYDKWLSSDEMARTTIFWDLFQMYYSKNMIT
jgi:hypothetical protein